MHPIIRSRPWVNTLTSFQEQEDTSVSSGLYSTPVTSSTAFDSLSDCSWWIFTAHSYAERCLSYNNSECASVCPSVTCRYCVKTNESRMMPFSLPGSPLTLVAGNIRPINIFARNYPLREWDSDMSQRRL